MAAKQGPSPTQSAVPSELAAGPIRSELAHQLQQGGEAPERRWCAEDAQTHTLPSFCRAFFHQLGGDQVELISRWQNCCAVPRALSAPRQPRHFLLLRHGSRPDRGADPSLDALGFQQAKQVAAFLQKELAGAPLAGLFASPFLRALQTAAPVAEALGLPIRVEWGFCEILAKGWLHREDPLATVRKRGFDGLPMSALLHPTYKSAVMPTFPDFEGRARPGDAAQRERALGRHRLAAEAALREAGPAGSVLVVCHGSTHDFVPGALCPEWHPPERHTPACVPHCGITMLVEQGPNGGWFPSTFGSTPWRSGPSEPAPIPLPMGVGTGGACGRSGAGLAGTARIAGGPQAACMSQIYQLMKPPGPAVSAAATDGTDPTTIPATAGGHWPGARLGVVTRVGAPGDAMNATEAQPGGSPGYRAEMQPPGRRPLFAPGPRRPPEPVRLQGVGALLYSSRQPEWARQMRDRAAAKPTLPSGRALVEVAAAKEAAAGLADPSNDGEEAGEGGFGLVLPMPRALQHEGRGRQVLL